MTGCPQLVGTSLPGRDSWALEEFMDTVISADPRARVELTRYRGVFVAYLARDPAEVAAKFLAYTHAFLARVYPVLLCAPKERLSDLLSGIASLVREGQAKLEVRLREPISRSVSEDDVKRLITSAGVRPGRSGSHLIIESLYDYFVASYGTAHACGPKCRVIVPTRLGGRQATK